MQRNVSPGYSSLSSSEQFARLDSILSDSESFTKVQSKRIFPLPRGKAFCERQRLPKLFDASQKRKIGNSINRLLRSRKDYDDKHHYDNSNVEYQYDEYLDFLLSPSKGRFVPCRRPSFSDDSTSSSECTSPWHAGDTSDTDSFDDKFDIQLLGDRQRAEKPNRTWGEMLSDCFKE